MSNKQQNMTSPVPVLVGAEAATAAALSDLGALAAQLVELCEVPYPVDTAVVGRIGAQFREVISRLGIDQELVDKCRVCGCTDGNECETGFGCYWVEEFKDPTRIGRLCSTCAENAPRSADAEVAL